MGDFRVLTPLNTDNAGRGKVISRILLINVLESIV